MVFWWTDASARIKGKGHISSFPHILYIKNIRAIYIIYIFSIHDTDILTGQQKRSSGDPY